MSFSKLEKGIFFKKIFCGCADMKLCVAGVYLNMIVEQFDEALLGGENDKNIERYLDNRFWRAEENGAENVIKVCPLVQLPPVGGQTIWESDTCTVKKSGDVEIRIYHDGVIKQPYAIYSDSRETGLRVWCEGNWLRRNYLKNYLLNICALEKLLIQNQRVVFHSCYIKTRGKALLFSGFSGVGIVLHVL